MMMIGMVWVKLKCNNEIFFILAVYIPPSIKDFGKVMQSIESDCIILRKLGKIIIMGDFNARIGNNESITHTKSGLKCLLRTRKILMAVEIALHVHVVSN